MRRVGAWAQIDHLECATVVLHAALHDEGEHLVNHSLFLGFLQGEDIIWRTALQRLLRNRLVILSVVSRWTGYFRVSSIVIFPHIGRCEDSIRLGVGNHQPSKFGF